MLTRMSHWRELRPLLRPAAAPRVGREVREDLAAPALCGLAAEALLLFGAQDVATARYQLDQNGNENQRRIDTHKLNSMVGFAESLTCRRRVLLGYLGEQMEVDCGNCDICLDPPERYDALWVEERAPGARGGGKALGPPAWAGSSRPSARCRTPPD